jgi:histidine triad (HIT) family protein
MSEENCLFCKIVDGKIPADFVHQDERCVVIRDINPQAPTHVLVIPRDHIESLDDASQKDEPLLGHLLRVGARVANDLGHGNGEGGYRSVINTGAGAGQSVFHLHVHVLGGRPMDWPPG